MRLKLEDLIATDRVGWVYYWSLTDELILVVKATDVPGENDIWECLSLEMVGSTTLHTSYQLDTEMSRVE